MLSDEMREELIQGLTNIFRNNISMIILYGLAARGDATQESDVDIAIIVKSQMDNVTKRRFLNWAAEVHGCTGLRIKKRGTDSPRKNSPGKTSRAQNIRENTL